MLTNSEGDLVDLELRHRRHPQVENRIRNLKDCGLERMPFAAFAANAAWMELVLTAADLLAWCQHLCLEGELARAEPAPYATGCCTPPDACAPVSSGAAPPRTLAVGNELAHAYQRLSLLTT